MNTAYMCYYEHLAKLARVANKQTLFLAHLLYRMEFDKDAKQWLVTLSSFDKRAIIHAIGSGTDDPLRMASQYLTKLCASGLFKSLGGGAYLVDPKSFSGSKYIPKSLRQKNGKIYETRVFTEESDGEVEAYLVTDDGERIDLV